MTVQSLFLRRHPAVNKIKAHGPVELRAVRRP